MYTCQYCKTKRHKEKTRTFELLDVCPACIEEDRINFITHGIPPRYVQDHFWQARNMTGPVEYITPTYNPYIARGIK